MKHIRKIRTRNLCAHLKDLNKMLLYVKLARSAYSGMYNCKAK